MAESDVTICQKALLKCGATLSSIDADSFDINFSSAEMTAEMIAIAIR